MDKTNEKMINTNLIERSYIKWVMEVTNQEYKGKIQEFTALIIK